MVPPPNPWKERVQEVEMGAPANSETNAFYPFFSLSLF